METFKFLAVIVVGYLLGSISVSIGMSRSMGCDVRKKGSGNAGATNMARIFGFKAGILTLLGDVLKAVLAMLLGSFLLGDLGIAAGGLAVLVGHCFPIFHHFRGGKGVSVGLAIAGAVDWRVLIVVVCTFFIGALLTKKVSVGSVSAAVTITVAALAFGITGPKLVLCVCGMCLVVFQHRENLRRLVRGEEPDFKMAKSPPSIQRGKKKDAQA